MIFGPEAVFERYLGYYAAVFVTSGYSQRNEHSYLSYAVPGKQISRFALRGDRTGFLFVFKKRITIHTSPARRPAKTVLLETFAETPWIEWPEIEKHLKIAKAICISML